MTSSPYPLTSKVKKRKLSAFQLGSQRNVKPPTPTGTHTMTGGGRGENLTMTPILRTQPQFAPLPQLATPSQTTPQARVPTTTSPTPQTKQFGQQAKDSSLTEPASAKYKPKTASTDVLWGTSFDKGWRSFERIENLPMRVPFSSNQRRPSGDPRPPIPPRPETPKIPMEDLHSLGKQLGNLSFGFFNQVKQLKQELLSRPNDPNLLKKLEKAQQSYDSLQEKRERIRMYIAKYRQFILSQRPQPVM